VRHAKIFFIHFKQNAKKTTLDAHFYDKFISFHSERTKSFWIGREDS